MALFDLWEGQTAVSKLVDEGASLFRLGDFKGAQMAFENAIRQDPNSAVAHSNLGLLFCKLGRRVEGIRCLKKALALDPRIEGTADFLAKVIRESQASAMSDAESTMDPLTKDIIGIIKKNLKDPPEAISPDTKLTDLEIESLDLQVIVFDIEDSFGIRIPVNVHEEAQGFATVGSVVERAKALIAAKNAA